MSLTIKDLEKFQAEHPDHRLELVDGGIVVMSPSGYESEEVASEVVRVIGKLGQASKIGSCYGF